MKIAICKLATVAALGAALTALGANDDGDAVLDLARRTLAYVAKSVPAQTLKPYADELELDAKWLAGETLPVSLLNPPYIGIFARNLHPTSPLTY